MTSSPTYAFGVSEFTTWPWSFERDIETYVRLGVAAIEVCEFKLDQERLNEQLASIAGSGLIVGSVQPSVRTLFPSKSQPEPQSPTDRMARFRDTIERFGDLAAGVPFVTNTGIPPEGNIQHVVDTAVREYREVADFAAARGALVALEPLNPSIANIETAIWTLDQGMAIVEAVDQPNFGICFDAWNLWQNAGIVEAARACAQQIFVVQLSDWRLPRSFQDRLVIGAGEIPLAPMLRALHEGGYRGPYSLEIFSGDVPDSLWAGDLEAVIQTSWAGLQTAWEQAFSQ